MKEILRDVKHLCNSCSITQEDRILFVIKSILLKYLLDNQYISGLSENLAHDFTINELISHWQGKPVDYFEESPLYPNEEDWNLVQEYLENGASLKGVNSSVLGVVYELLSSESSKKKQGMYYTPPGIVKHMIKMLNMDFSKPHRILDPACGSGFFLSALYDEIFSHVMPKTEESKYQLHQEVLSNVLFGMEKDPVAALISKLVLQLKHPIYTPFQGIILQDALLDEVSFELQNSFDFILGNPPYIGHKMIDKELSLALKEKFAEVFYDKGDMSYCFFPLALSLLKANGQVIYICSRYFIESLSGRGLREFITDHFQINAIMDFNGNRLIKGAKVDLAILHLTKKISHGNAVQVYKLRENLKVKAYDEIFEADNYYEFSLKQSDLNEEGWVLMDSRGQDIIDKIHQKAQVSLQEMGQSHQGIITGCDKAFVVDEADIGRFNEDLIVPWVKNKNVRKYEITPSGKYLLYTDSIEDLEQFPELESHLSPFKERLASRRECKNGVRKWYMLQWGRKRETLQCSKILFPYKASANRFAFDEEGLFFSADIYALILKEEYVLKGISYKFLVCLLNSKLYEFYFKTIGKKLGGTLYEYYPNTVMRLKIPTTDSKLIAQFEHYYDNIKELDSEEKTKDIRDKIDQDLYAYFGLNKDDIQLI